MYTYLFANCMEQVFHIQHHNKYSYVYIFSYVKQKPYNIQLPSTEELYHSYNIVYGTLLSISKP